jgi:hypothetical protein
MQARGWYSSRCSVLPAASPSAVVLKRDTASGHGRTAGQRV